MQKTTMTIIRKCLLIMLGSFIYSVAINSLLLPHQIGEGGVTGLTAIGYYALHIQPALTNIVLNSIILLIGFKLLDKKTIFYSLWCVIWISIFLKLPPIFQYHTKQTLIPAIIAGVFMGIALGLIYRADGTIAGSTIIASILNKYLGIQTGSAMLFCDLLVAIPSGFIIGTERMFLTMIELYISAVVLNIFNDMFGAKYSIKIITPKVEQMSAALSDQLKQGITMVHTHGYYSGEQRAMIYIICSKKQSAKLFPLIEQIDPNAMIVLEQVHSVAGHQLNMLK
ncbi:DUF2179 domain-containing protein [Ligilactobacillus pobuzihii]|uniref:YitT family protein n=1 Tax=Ligilactobacillus pobuzihii TaxID=449659 RepID=UPI0019D00800|nr:YitT family protein [Ligilactobacillus pobuzihii]MBN7274956.1 DUF2179 domain-containing protein [Ligilactobacillus pobuzihii]